MTTRRGTSLVSASVAARNLRAQAAACVALSTFEYILRIAGDPEVHSLVILTFRKRH